MTPCRRIIKQVAKHLKRLATKHDAEFFEGVDDTLGISGAGTRRR